MSSPHMFCVCDLAFSACGGSVCVCVCVCMWWQCVYVCASYTHPVGSWLSTIQSDLSGVVKRSWKAQAVLSSFLGAAKGEPPLVGWTPAAPQTQSHHHGDRRCGDDQWCGRVLFWAVAFSLVPFVSHLFGKVQSSMI